MGAMGTQRTRDTTAPAQVRIPRQRTPATPGFAAHAVASSRCCRCPWPERSCSRLWQSAPPSWISTSPPRRTGSARRRWPADSCATRSSSGPWPDHSARRSNASAHSSPTGSATSGRWSTTSPTPERVDQPVPLVFLGASIDTTGDPGDFVAAFRSGAQGYRITEVDVGPGARGVCAETPTGVHRTYCAWSTGDSIGELLPTVAGWDTQRLAALMRDIRADAEHPM